MNRSAEAIAEVVADLRARRITLWPGHPRSVVETALSVADDMVIVDCTPIYQGLVAREDPVWIYEDHPCIAPAWPQGAFCFENEHGNVVVMIAAGKDHHLTGEPPKAAERWVPGEHRIDWSAVRWTINTTVWVGGYSRTTRSAYPTTGPLFGWRFAVAADGTPLDLHWIHYVDQYPREHWDMSQLVLLGALNLLGCANVEALEPARPRAQAKRLARTGVRVHTIHVRPAGAKRRSVGAAAREIDPAVPLHSVRGHFATYGGQRPDGTPRGLLFGKHAGRFWIPGHARGAAEHGEVHATYALHPPRPAEREATG